MTAIQANGITIKVEQYGPPDGKPLVLVRGLGSQLIHWPAVMLERFVANGFLVTVYDNRDAGLSQKFDHAPAVDTADIETRQAAGQPIDTAYTLDDMARDGIGVLDVLDIERAHIVGTSLGGMLVQIMAAHYPQRVLSLTSIMSSSGNPQLPLGTSAEIRKLLLQEPDDPNDRDAVIEFTLAGDRAWGSPGFPFSEAEQRRLIEQAYDRCYCPQGALRQWTALCAHGSRVALLQTIRVPSLVIHGNADPLIQIEHGRDTAKHIPDAEFIEIDGMGHNLAGDLSGLIADHVIQFTRKVR